LPERQSVLFLRSMQLWWPRSADLLRWHMRTDLCSNWIVLYRRRMLDHPARVGMLGLSWCLGCGHPDMAPVGISVPIVGGAPAVGGFWADSAQGAWLLDVRAGRLLHIGGASPEPVTFPLQALGVTKSNFVRGVPTDRAGSIVLYDQLEGRIEVWRKLGSGGWNIEWRGEVDTAQIPLLVWFSGQTPMLLAAIPRAPQSGRTVLELSAWAIGEHSADAPVLGRFQGDLLIDTPASGSLLVRAPGSLLVAMAGGQNRRHLLLLDSTIWTAAPPFASVEPAGPLRAVYPSEEAGAPELKRYLEAVERRGLIDGDSTGEAGHGGASLERATMSVLSAPRIGMIVAGQSPHLWIRNALHYTQGATWRCTDARTYEPCGSFVERYNERAVRAAVARSGKLLLLTENIEGRLRYSESSPR